MCCLLSTDEEVVFCVRYGRVEQKVSKHGRWELLTVKSAKNYKKIIGTETETFVPRISEPMLFFKPCQLSSVDLIEELQPCTLLLLVFVCV
jgi:hypothetical protein